MSDSKVKRENFITIQGWMVSDLKLKGNELLVYAIIYGFTQDGESRFTGSLKYLADWTNSSKQGVTNCLKSLCEKELITKTDKVINGVKFCEYHSTNLDTVYKKVGCPIQESCIGGIQKSLPNNITIYNNSNNQDNKESKKERKKDSFDIIISEYARGDQEVEELLGEWLKVRKAKRAAMTDKAIELNLKKLDSLAMESNMSVPDYLREVICRGWQAFYPINNNNYKKSERSSNIFAEIGRERGIF